MKQGEYEIHNHLPKFDRMEGMFNNEEFNNENSQELGLGRVSFPHTEVETGVNTGFKNEVAQITGRFSDQVVMGSPATETEDMNIGRTGLEDVIEASEEELANKMKKREN
ncbi:hypothetical protein [Halonatronum saccharophilum]|uniref:hypothetical protein n=1 Tax=Halonatronum saccharophilum TaxID=150060 RepID=UPI0004B3A5AF|nr:hypothetical protein [Halonatronum saccharophilum]